MLLLPFLKTETRDYNCCQDSLRGASIRTQWLKGSSNNLHKLPLTSGQRAVWNLSQETSCVAQGPVASREQMPAFLDLSLPDPKSYAPKLSGGKQLEPELSKAGGTGFLSSNDPVPTMSQTQLCTGNCVLQLST